MNPMTNMVHDCKKSHEVPKAAPTYTSSFLAQLTHSLLPRTGNSLQVAVEPQLLSPSDCEEQRYGLGISPVSSKDKDHY